MKRAKKKGRKKSLDSEKKKPVTKKKTKADFLEDRKKTLIDTGKGWCILVPIFLPGLFLLVFPHFS